MTRAAGDKGATGSATLLTDPHTPSSFARPEAPTGPATPRSEAEVGPGEVGVKEVRPGEDRAGEVHPGEVLAGEVLIGEVSGAYRFALGWGDYATSRRRRSVNVQPLPVA